MGCLDGVFSNRQKKPKHRSRHRSTPPSPTPVPQALINSDTHSNNRRPFRYKGDDENILPGCDPVRVLGEGTFGTVVLVRERSTKEYFAVKVMSKSQLVHEAQLENIVLERQVLYNAGPHPFVVECHSGFQTNDAVVLVLEYLPGGDMYDLMKSHGTLEEKQAMFYLAETVVGLAELHRHGFVFRDLKLENILLDAAGHVRLTDFGLSGKTLNPFVIDDKSIIDISGTAIYQAPEILSGKGHGVLVDWWALGVLAYVLLTGRPPFPNSGTREELCHIISHQELDLSTDNRLTEVSDDCKDLISKLLTKTPELRLGSEKDAADVKAHPFFSEMDWDKILKYEVKPPLGPARTGPKNMDSINQDEAQAAREELKKRLGGKHKARGRKLDASAYKPVRVGHKRNERRISIGLDFGDQNAEASARTWTGTTDDFGRRITH